MTSTAVSRRTFLRGAGVSVALPLLDIMQSSSRAEANDEKPPNRAAFFYVPNGVVQESWHPSTDGPRFELSPTLQPLASVKSEVSLFSHLDRIKVAGTDGHAQASTCWLSSAAPDELSPAGYPLKKTVDQIIAQHVGHQTAFRSLELSCNPYEDNRESIYFDNISWYGHGHVARSLRDPRSVFNRLFRVEEKRELGSILDLVLEDARGIRHELGHVDRAKLEEYIESIRTVEKQIERVTERQAEINRMDLQQPVKPWQTMDRDEFIQVMGDLMILALRADLTRVATLMTAPERWGTPLKVQGLFKKPIVHHSMTHNQGNPNVLQELKELDQFHVEQFAVLVNKMKATPEGEGTLLDSMIFTFGSGLSSGALHIYTDLPLIVAGRAGGGLTPDRHYQSAVGTPVANLWLSIARTMGVPMRRLGDSTGTLNAFRDSA